MRPKRYRSRSHRISPATMAQALGAQAMSTLPITFLVMILPVVLAITLTGCATIGSDSRIQGVLVRSDPPGATILVDQKAVGETPRYILLERERRPSFDLKLGDQTKKVDVQTKYRWGTSFGRNFVFLIYAPVGWLVDVISGAAWQAVDTPVIDMSTGKKTAKREPDPHARTIAIAPPFADAISLSDAGGQALQQELASVGYKVRPYQDTLFTFISNGYDFDGAPRENARQLLYAKLDVDAIYESKIEAKDDHLVLTGTALDVVSKQTDAPTSLTFEPSGDVEHLYSGRGLFQFIPNTIGLDLVSEKLAWSQGTETIELVPARNEEWWSKGLRYVSALNITSLPARRPGRASRGIFNFVPTLRFSRKDVVATGAPDVEDRRYLRWLISAGYGLEAGWQVSRHYVYFDLIPQIFWNQITWKKDGEGFSRTGTGVNFLTEIGYLFFFDSHWNIRLFARSANEDTDAWKEALGRSSGSQPGYVGLQTFGLSVGYRFEPTIQDHRWKSAPKNRRE